MNIEVGSNNGHKIAAARESTMQIFQGTSCNIRGQEGVNKGLPAQIEGEDKILEGALHRLSELKKIADQTKTDLFLVMQDGIYSREINGKRHWFNMAWVIAEDSEGNQSFIPSASIEIPEEIVEEARRRGFKTTTIGDIIAEDAGNDADATDPQTTLTNDILGRSEILRQALKAAIGQLLGKSVSLRKIRSAAST